MVKRIVWSKNALKDKIQILDYWNRRTGTKTYSIILDNQLRIAIKSLKELPELGRQLENSEIRFLVKDHYQIFYKFIDTEIRVLHIWDSRRNPNGLILEE